MRKIDGPHYSSKVIFLSEKVAVATFSTVSAIGISFIIVTVIAWISYWSLPLMPGKNVPEQTIVAATEASVISPDSPQELIATPPVQIHIPTLEIDTKIQSVGLTKRGAMDVPSSTDEVGWFSLGFKPGQLGNAVVTGHYDTLWMRPAVFARINTLTENDEIKVTDESEMNWVFVVKSVQTYPLKEVPLSELFGASDTAKLNLITCSGRWSWKMGSYSERTVVRTELLRVEPTSL